MTRPYRWLAVLPTLGLLGGVPFANRVRPYVLGLPFLLAWIVAWVVATSLIMALIFALAHVPFLATSLEDIDSVNFALGIRHFDVATHRPHPPGYPV